MRTRCIIAGNWKMNGLQSHIASLAVSVAEHTKKVTHPHLSVVIFPPATLISAAVSATQRLIAVGGQDCHAKENGAYTGDIAASMLKDLGASYVLVGHSERRQYHAESSQLVKEKAQAALKAGLIPVICIGETLEQREAGQMETVLAEQIAQSIPSESTPDNTIIAYEPVWAIGTGKVATPQQVAETHAFIESKLPKGMAILYGGSVKADNATEILAIPAVSGVLVGGASLKAEEFNAIISAGAAQVSKG
jgi:triosephosphate isomerase (TIM)